VTFFQALRYISEDHRPIHLVARLYTFTGQNPASSQAVAQALLKRLATEQSA
jgi:putative intracellular protease/amidase